MVPTTDILIQEIQEYSYPTKTYKIVFNDQIKDKYAFGVGSDNYLEIVSDDTLSGFTYENGTLSISYNTKLAGYDLAQDEGHNLTLNMTTSLDELDRISGYIDGVMSVAQTIYLILSTERYRFIIYSWNYGVELLDLFGKPMSYVMAELPRRIKEALTQDDRINDVVNFKFEKNGKVLHTTFTVITNVGNITTEMGVNI